MMRLTDYMTGTPVEVASSIVIEMHSRGPFTEIKTGINIDGVVVTSRYTVRENVPQIMEMLRKEATS